MFVLSGTWIRFWAAPSYPASSFPLTKPAWLEVRDCFGWLWGKRDWQKLVFLYLIVYKVLTIWSETTVRLNRLNKCCKSDQKSDRNVLECKAIRAEKSCPRNRRKKLLVLVFLCFGWKKDMFQFENCFFFTNYIIYHAHISLGKNALWACQAK